MSEQPPAEPTWRRDFPYQSSGEEEVTRREFARYLVLGAGAFAIGNVGLAAWTQLRSINTGEPRPIVAVEDGLPGIRAARAAGIPCVVVGDVPAHVALEADGYLPSIAGLTAARLLEIAAPRSEPIA